MRKKNLYFLIIALLTLSACEKKDPIRVTKNEIHQNPQVLDPGSNETTIPGRESYLNGQAFCEKYKEQLKLEHGRWIRVPVDYSRPEGAQMQIYAYTYSPFDPNLPSSLHIDGGPGQNTHLAGRRMDGRINEIYFDQRGLGCSAPPTWDEYSSPSLYSSLNTVKDMEMIRKAFGISKWSLFGVSYGTIPATIYGALYPESLTSLVLEGTVGPLSLIHSPQYKAEKLNELRASLGPTRSAQFDKMLTEKTPEKENLIKLIFKLFFESSGLTRLKEKLLDVFITDSGQLKRQEYTDFMNQLKPAIQSEDEQQHKPASIDPFVYLVLACRELNYEESRLERLNFTSGVGFLVQPERPDQNPCARIGMPKSLQDPFDLRKYKISVPVYYFQGSHDGATPAKGALTHWQSVPTGPSYFFLKTKGGHNPLNEHLLRPLQEHKAKNPFHDIFFLATIGSENIKEELFALPETKANQKVEKWRRIPRTEEGYQELLKLTAGF